MEAARRGLHGRVCGYGGSRVGGEWEAGRRNEWTGSWVDEWVSKGEAEKHSWEGAPKPAGAPL